MDRYPTEADAWRKKSAGLIRYLKTRPSESWGFLAAGIVIAKIFL